MELSLSKRVLKINFNGERELSLTYPTVMQLREYYKTIKDKDGEVLYDAMGDFLEKLGMPKEIYIQLEQDHLTQVMNTLSDIKKN
jgi:hypothetical protein